MRGSSCGSSRQYTWFRLWPQPFGGALAPCAESAIRSSSRFPPQLAETIIDLGQIRHQDPTLRSRPCEPQVVGAELRLSKITALGIHRQSDSMLVISIL